MALTRTREQLRDAVRYAGDVQALLERHRDVDLDDLVNRGVAVLHRKLSQIIPDQRYLASTTITTEAGRTVYGLQSNFRTLVSAELHADGRKSHIDAFEMRERPALADTTDGHRGAPTMYRLRGGSNVELLPTPDAPYQVLLWYVPDAPQLASDGSTVDVVDRLDDYIVWYATREVLFRDKQWDAHDRLTAKMAEMEADLYVLARSRDLNSPSRIVSVRQYDRYGRMRR